MSYIVPQPYKCVKCDYEFVFSPHHTHAAPVLSIDERNVPMCPVCYAKFLMAHVGLSFSTSKYRPEGSDYEIEKAKA